MTKLFSLSILILLFLGLSQCGPAEESTQEEISEETETSEAGEESEEVAKKYTLTEVSSPEFEGASLSLNNVEDGQKLEAGAFTFEFGVDNYELGTQTSDAEGKGLANSPKGQHIHFILNNGPYSAHYEPKAEKELPEGNHVLLAFLSRSYHESVKSEGAYILKTFSVGEAGESDIDPTGPHMFYSRPKGDYTMAEGDQLLLDFFLINTTISADGNKVKATINGEEHMIEKWAPYAIDGLELGEVSIKLELVDSEGNVIEGPFNTVERKVNLLAPEEGA
ncbi:MAG: phosphopeptide-binding protein [Bacteroidota bacterium]